LPPTDRGRVSHIIDAVRSTKAKRPGARSLSVSPAFRSFVLDQLEEVGDVAPRSMFGGVGLYHRGTFFGIIARDTLYLKVGDANRVDYERAKATPFKPYPDRSGTMKYYAVPVEILESALDLAAWARKAIAVANGGRARAPR
jgi:TfoX/Sxy family transcriptional regulator of competence genes